MQTKQPKSNRGVVVGVLFAFLLLHNTDKGLISPLTTPIMETFNINEAQMGAVSTVALIVGAILYPVWGYLYDRYARVKLLALASFLWGATTTLNASARTYPVFLVTRGSTGIDDSSYPGIYSLIADYFLPKVRGRVYGILAISGPLGALISLTLGVLLSEELGWRNIFYVTGGLGILLAIVIFFVLKEPQRGQSEPELAGVEAGKVAFSWQNVRQLLQKKTLLFLLSQGFFSVFPYMVINFWFFRYLEVERFYDENQIYVTMLAALFASGLGLVFGGTLGDLAFRHTRRGRLLVSTAGMLLSLILINIAIRMPVEQVFAYGVLSALTAFCMTLSNPNVTATISDVTLPEVRSTAQAAQLFVENIGAALAPFVAGLIAVQSNLFTAIAIVTPIGWGVSALLFALAVKHVPGDIERLKGQLEERARQQVSA